MVEVPEGPTLLERLTTWYEKAQELKKLKASEMLLRKSIFDSTFPDPQEGTNSYDLDDGYVLKGKHSLTRNVDEGAFMAIKAKLIENEIKVDDLVKWKPEISKSQYNKLTEAQRKLFDQCLIVKPGSPALEIVLPAKAKGKADG